MDDIAVTLGVAAQALKDIVPVIDHVCTSSNSVGQKLFIAYEEWGLSAEQSAARLHALQFDGATSVPGRPAAATPMEKGYASLFEPVRAFRKTVASQLESAMAASTDSMGAAAAAAGGAGEAATSLAQPVSGGGGAVGAPSQASDEAAPAASSSQSTATGTGTCPAQIENLYVTHKKWESRLAVGAPCLTHGLDWFAEQSNPGWVTYTFPARLVPLNTPPDTYLGPYEREVFVQGARFIAYTHAKAAPGLREVLVFELDGRVHLEPMHRWHPQDIDRSAPFYGWAYRESFFVPWAYVPHAAKAAGLPEDT